MEIKEHVAQIMHDIQLAVARRRVSSLLMPDVKLIAVTKNQDVPAIRSALAAGITAIGENRVQEALTKYDELKHDTEWHFIGHLQTNKVRQVVPLFQLIHSVDTEKLVVEIDRIAAKEGKLQDVLIQVNVAGEETKSGISRRQALTLAKQVAGLEHVRLRGFMTIAPLFEDAEQTRPIFRELFAIFMEARTLLPHIQLDWLSMGMTNDYLVAIEEGANLVRIGTGIFGKRN